MKGVSSPEAVAVKQATRISAPPADPNAIVRLGVSPYVLQEHMISVLSDLRHTRYPKLVFNITPAEHFRFPELFKSKKVDLAMTTLSEPPPPGCRTRLLTRLKTVLLVPRRSKVKSAASIWQRQPQTERLIGPASHDPIARQFHRQLARNHIIWRPSMEFDSIDLIETFVGDGLGVGVSVVIPGRKFSRRVRALPLPGFPTVAIGFLFPAELDSMPRAARDFMTFMKRRLKKRIPVGKREFTVRPDRC